MSGLNRRVARPTTVNRAFVNDLMSPPIQKIGLGLAVVRPPKVLTAGARPKGTGEACHVTRSLRTEELAFPLPCLMFNQGLFG